VERSGSLIRQAGVLLYRFPGLRLALLLAPPLVWMVVVYLLALAFLFLTLSLIHI